PRTRLRSRLQFLFPAGSSLNGIHTPVKLNPRPRSKTSHCFGSNRTGASLGIPSIYNPRVNLRSCANRQQATTTLRERLPLLRSVSRLATANNTRNFFFIVESRKLHRHSRRWSCQTGKLKR